jgi:hypothetical protein
MALAKVSFTFCCSVGFPVEDLGTATEEGGEGWEERCAVRNEALVKVDKS